MCLVGRKRTSRIGERYQLSVCRSFFLSIAMRLFWCPFLSFFYLCPVCVFYLTLWLFGSLSTEMAREEVGKPFTVIAYLFIPITRDTLAKRKVVGTFFNDFLSFLKHFFGKRGSNTPTTFQTNFGCFIFFFFSTFYMFVCYLYKSVSFSRDWLGIL